MGEALGSVNRDRVIWKRNADALKQGSGGPAIRRALELPVGQRRQRSGHPPGGVRVRGAQALDGFRGAGEVVLIQGLDFRHEHEAAEVIGVTLQLPFKLPDRLVEELLLKLRPRNAEDRCRIGRLAATRKQVLKWPREGTRKVFAPDEADHDTRRGD